MKVWTGHGTEHSMNLVMIGRFQDVPSAADAMELIQKFQTAAETEESEGRLHAGEHNSEYSDPVLNLLSETNVAMVQPHELEQLLYDVQVEHRDDEIVITTDEIEVQVFMKLLLAKGAKVEVFSAHDHQDTDHGR